MTWTRLELILIVAAFLLVVLAFYLRGLAARLDRLHLRVDASSAALEARLERRAALSVEVALSGVLDPASAVLLLNAATTAQHAGEQRSTAESDLSAALRAVFPDDETVAVLVGDGDVGDPEDTQTAEDAQNGKDAQNPEDAQNPADPDDLETRDTLTELGETCQGVVLARRFANDATRAAVHVRRRGVVRALRLAGHAPWPPSRDLDDAPPEALTGLAMNSA